MAKVLGRPSKTPVERTRLLKSAWTEHHFIISSTNSATNLLAISFKQPHPGGDAHWRATIASFIIVPYFSASSAIALIALISSSNCWTTSSTRASKSFSRFSTEVSITFSWGKSSSTILANASPSTGMISLILFFRPLSKERANKWMVSLKTFSEDLRIAAQKALTAIFP